MSSIKRALLGGRTIYHVHIGDVIASRDPLAVRTVLGSCIAVCLWDPIARVGGMNHFMLPDPDCGGTTSARYGVNAMELLINACMHEGADRRRLEAKVFGGGHVLRMKSSDNGVPESNVRFALRFLATENIPLVSRDVGGRSAREIYFLTDKGAVYVKRLTATGSEASAALQHLARVEMGEYAKTLHESADESNITLFNEDNTTW